MSVSRHLLMGGTDRSKELKVHQQLYRPRDSDTKWRYL